jgi:hypothetical protein
MSSRALVYAPQRLIDETAPLLNGAVLEREIQRAIERGDVEATNEHGVVFLDGFGIERRPGKRRPTPRAWYVRSIEPNWNEQRRNGADRKIA